MNKEEITFASIVPLIGGESLGMSKALGGKMPEWVASYEAFAANDGHYINYLRKHGWEGEYITLPDPTEDHEADQRTTYVDIVNAVPPCAGLSSFASKNDCSKNDWMLHTAEYVLRNVKPKVFWGENAPRLASKAGTEVREQLLSIARKHGYSATFYKTQARIHGVAQKRPRTFYFLWKNAEAPVLGNHSRPNRGFANQIAGDFRPDDEHATQFLNTKKPSDDPYYQWAMHCLNIDEHQELAEKSPISLIEKGGKWDDSKEEWENYADMADWLREQDPEKHRRVIDRLGRMSEKLRLKQGGIWHHGITMIASGDVCPAFIGVQPMELVHPTEDRYLNIRECLRMMDMPEDFELLDWKRSYNHIAQNVDVDVAADAASDVIKYILGKLPSSGCDYIIQTNGKSHIEYLGNQTSTLDQFL